MCFRERAAQMRLILAVRSYVLQQTLHIACSRFAHPQIGASRLQVIPPNIAVSLVCGGSGSYSRVKSVTYGLESEDKLVEIHAKE
jgi:hypothetical protein